MKTRTQTQTLAPNRHPLRLLAATITVALAAGLAQTASAQPHEGRGPGGPGGPGMGLMAAPHQMERLLDAVNASAEQRTQIRQIMKSAADDLRAQRDSGRKLHQDMQALFTQPTVDARAAEALRQQMLAQHDTASKRMLQAMLDASRVLSPEQRKTLADKMAQRRSMMERHRSERESFDKPAQ